MNTPPRSEPAGEALPSVWRAAVARPVGLLLIALMALGSVFLWLGVPFGWIWAVSHMVKTSQPTLGPYLLVLVAIPLTMWLVGRVLYRLNHLYSRVSGRTYEVRVQLPWQRSLRDSRDTGRQTTVLDVVMIVSVSIALVAFGIWFFFFAGSSIPNV